MRTSWLKAILSLRAHVAVFDSGEQLYPLIRIQIGSAMVFDRPDLSTYSTTMGRPFFFPLPALTPLFAPVRQIR